MKNDSGFSISAWSLAASLALNATAFWGIDKVAGPHSAALKAEMAAKRAAAEAGEDSVSLEFIESPPVLSEKPVETKRISNRDAANRDTEGKGPGGAPKITTEGVIDQLAQDPTPSPPPSPPAPRPMQASEPREEKQAVSAVEEMPAPEKAAEPSPMAQTAEGDVVVPPEQQPAPPLEPQNETRAQAESPAVPPVPPAEQPAFHPPAKIMTRQMGRSGALGASLQGTTSFEATGSGMGVYMKELKEKIWLAWFPYLVSKYPSDFATADVVLSIVIGKDGRLRSVRIADSRGARVFADFCVEAVQRAGPFKPLPEEILALLPKDELEIYFAFHYM